MSEKIFMRRAITLAKKGAGYVNPNPLVGAVLVKDGKIIGEGYHHKYGEQHAERECIADCVRKGNSASGATLYVTLEPCCHYGKQPPCTQAIIDANIKKVVVGSSDPNPLVSWKGIAFLKEHNIEVETGFMKNECDNLNRIFFYYIVNHHPYVALKIAATIDGKTSTATGKSKWITCEKSRNYVHNLRNRYSAVLTGINTVMNDNPLLTCRLKKGRNPVRVILDSNLRINIDSKIVMTAYYIKTIIFFCKESSDTERKIKILNEYGIETVFAPSLNNRVDISFVLNDLYSRNLDSILVEAGGEVNASFLKSGFVNYIYYFTAPVIFGGTEHCSIGGSGIDKVEEAIKLNFISLKKTGSDYLVEYSI